MKGLKLDEENVTLVNEISALSGYGRNIVKEILEFLAYDWAVKIADTPNKFATLTIPYLGSVAVRYKGDTVLDSGEVETEVDSFINVSSDFKKLIGDIHDEGYNVLIPMIEKKIENAVMVASAE